MSRRARTATEPSCRRRFARHGAPGSEGSAPWSRIGPEASRYDAVARRITHPKPSAYAIFDYPDSFTRLRAALLRTEWDPDVTYVTDTLASSALAAAAGAEGEGVRGTTPGIFVNSQAARAFDQLFAKAEGPDRQIFDAQEFDAVVLCYLATVAAGSSEPGKVAQKMREISSPGGKRYSWQQLAPAIRAVEHGNGHRLRRRVGPIDLDRSGDATSGVRPVPVPGRQAGHLRSGGNPGGRSGCAEVAQPKNVPANCRYARSTCFTPSTSDSGTLVISVPCRAAMRPNSPLDAARPP